MIEGRYNLKWYLTIFYEHGNALTLTPRLMFLFCESDIIKNTLVYARPLFLTTTVSTTELTYIFFCISRFDFCVECEAVFFLLSKNKNVPLMCVVLPFETRNKVKNCHPMRTSMLRHKYPRSRIHAYPSTNKLRFCPLYKYILYPIRETRVRPQPWILFVGILLLLLSFFRYFLLAQVVRDCRPLKVLRVISSREFVDYLWCHAFPCLAMLF